MKYNNPVDKVQFIKIPRWEYAKLCGSRATLNIVARIVANTESYNLKDTLSKILDVYLKEEQ